MPFTDLLQTWRTQPARQKTRQLYSIQLTTGDAARLHALVELFPGTEQEQIVTDLLHAALQEIEAAMPYAPGNRVIREDDFGDPVYEDVGMTPRFLELIRKYEKVLSIAGDE
jgi:hypothetical protein